MQIEEKNSCMALKMFKRDLSQTQYGSFHRNRKTMCVTTGQGLSLFRELFIIVDDCV